MNTPDPESVGLLAKVIGAAALVVAPVWGARTWLEKRFEKKVDKHHYKSDQQAVANTFSLHREDMKELREVLRKQDADAEVRHREILMHLLRGKE